MLTTPKQLLFQQSPSYSYIIFLATYFMFFFKLEMSLLANQADHNTTTIVLLDFCLLVAT
jgi:hypothetical protein